MADPPSKEHTEQYFDSVMADSLSLDHKDWCSEDDLAKTGLALHLSDASEDAARTKTQGITMILRGNDFPSNWQDEMHHHGSSAYRSNDLGVGPSKAAALESRAGHAGSRGTDWQTKTSFVPMLRLPPEYVWSGKREGYQKHFDYEPYDTFGGREIIDEKTKTSKLGDGGFGNVRRVLCKGRLLARKEMLPQQGGDYDIRREATILENLVHRHIVELAGTYTQDGTLYILLYPVAECNLSQMLQTPKAKQSISWERNLMTAFGCLAGALAFIHSKDVAIKHKDIKPANILFYGDMVLLADWGLSNCFKSEETSRSRGWTYCTPAYAAPEVRARDERGTAQDIFSLGLVYEEMLAALCGVLIWEQQCIGESRISVHNGIEMMPKHKTFLAKGAVPQNIPTMENVMSLVRYPARCNALNETKEHERALWLGTRSPTLFETMLAESPADRPTAHQVWQFMKAPESFGSPCDGCCDDEARWRVDEA